MKGIPQPHKSIPSNLDFRLKGFFLLLFHFLYLVYSSLMQIKQLLVIIQVCTKICWPWLSVCDLLCIFHPVFFFWESQASFLQPFLVSHILKISFLLISFQLHPNCWNCSWSALPKIAQNVPAETSAALKIAR